MTVETRIRRLRTSAARAVDSLFWYYRTRPDAWRHLVGPGFGVILTLWLSLAWGLLGPLLALGVVGSFAVFATRLIDELRSLETETSAGVELEAGDVAWFRRLAEEEPSQPKTETRASEAEEPRPAPELQLPTLRLEATAELAPPAEAPPVEPDPPPARQPVPVTVPGEPVYELCEVAAGSHLPVQTGTSFLDATDVAFELIEENDPAELEIVRITGDQRETVWTYRRSESPTESDRPGPGDVARLDVTRSTDQARAGSQD
jgi:hypothetical protein